MKQLFKKVLKNNYLFIFFILVVLIFFSPLFLKGFLPIPSDTVVGLYHPFRDLYSSSFPNGVPFKNFLITDPVRQTYPWKNIVISDFENFSLPLWNPYEMTGTPLLANFQSSPFYPLNFILFLKPFYFSWSLFIFLQPILAGFFLYLYLKNLNLDGRARLLGVISFTFSGFFISWLEWGTVIHTALWLPLILLSIDKVLIYSSSFDNSKLQFKNKKVLVWSFIFIFSLASSFFAGHLQIFFYLFTFSFIYFLARWFQFGRKIKTLGLFAIYYLLFVILISIQLIPTFQFIFLSARSVDQVFWQTGGWFIPWQHLIQFISPDFFGNPTTLNYWGVWNYAELVGYIGVIPLIFAVFSIFFRFDKKTLFFGAAVFVSLLLSLPTPLAKIPFLLNLPFLSSSQPTRLLFITTFSFSVLAGLGFDYYLKNIRVNQKILKGMIVTFVLFVVGYALLWIFVFFGQKIFSAVSTENIITAKRNLIFPSVVFILSSILIFALPILKKKYLRNILVMVILVIAVVDLFRFATKFETFADESYLFPDTKVIEFLKNQDGVFRVVANDSRILPPNFPVYYRIQSIEGYDPLYLLSYGQFIIASERGKNDISTPFGFNRIITPHNLNSKFIDLMNVKYVLSLSDINSTKFTKVFEEGQTKVYENKDVFSRAFFVKNLISEKDQKEQLQKMFSSDLKTTAVIENDNLKEYSNLSLGKVRIENYLQDRIDIRTKNDGDGFLVLTDSYYPIWKVLIDNKQAKIYRTDYNFRGVFVPKGEHKIEFYATLF